MDKPTELALLDLGEQCCGSDYAVRNYLLPYHPLFFGSGGKLLSALRRAAATGPNEEQKYHFSLIDEVLANRSADLRYHGKSEVRGEILGNEERIRQALLRFEDAGLENLLREAAEQLGLGYAADSDFWLEDNGFTENPQNINDSNDEDGYAFMVCVPGGLRNHLLKNLRSKKRHAFIAQLAGGLVLLVQDDRDICEERIPLYYGMVADFLFKK
jgi:hypothetical protein